MMSSFGIKLGLGFTLVVAGTSSISSTSAQALSKNTVMSMDLATIIAAVGGIAAFVYWAARDRASVDARLDRLDEAAKSQMEATKRLEDSMSHSLKGIRDDMHEFMVRKK